MAPACKFFLDDLTGTPWADRQDRSRSLQALHRPDQVRRRGLSLRDHLQAQQHRSRQGQEGFVPEIRAVGRRDRGRASEQGLRLSQGRLTRRTVLASPNGGRQHGRASRGPSGSRPHQCAGRAVLLLSAGAARRRGHQGRDARHRRSRAPARRRSGAQPRGYGRVVPGAECRQALDHAESEACEGARGVSRGW